MALLSWFGNHSLNREGGFVESNGMDVVTPSLKLDSKLSVCKSDIVSTYKRLEYPTTTLNYRL